MSNLREAAQALQALMQARQQDRLLRLHFPRDDGPDALLVPNQLDAHEGLSRDFHFRVQLLSENARIALKDVQGKMVTIELVREDGSLRYFNGYVFEFRLVKTDGGFAHYDMVLLPWLAYLRLRHDNYLFHGKSVYQQTDAICRDYDVADWQIEVIGDDEPMTDACQFDETDYNYLHRRWEALGWHYRYEHRKDGHTLILSNDSVSAKPIDGKTPDIPWQSEAGSTEDDGVSSLTPVRLIVPAQVAVSSFDFKSPRPVTVDVPTLNRQGDVLPLEIYEYAGAYGFKNRADGNLLARRRMEEIEAGGKHFEVKSNDRYTLPGRWFRLTGHFDAKAFGPDPNQEFLILEVTHEVHNNYLQDGGAPAYYKNEFVCIRKAIPWRPGRSFNSTEPRVYGLQTAIVVGPKGQEIHTDKYGRIRVQFHWDREGQHDERSSAWIRVSQPWAGKGWGAVAIPRIGQEVVVQFLDGNPDRPLVTGSLFNEHNMPPYALPGGNHMMGFKSKLHARRRGYSEMVIHDSKGSELVNIHAQKDIVTTVLHNDSTTVNGPKQTTQVTTGYQETTVKQHVKLESTSSEITVKAATRITLECGASKIVMDKDGTITVTGTAIKSIASGEHVIIGAPLKLNPSAAPTASAPTSSAASATPASAGGAAAASAGAKGSPSSPPPAKPTPPVASGLGQKVDDLAAKSPKLQADLAALKAKGWTFKYGEPGKGSYADRSSIPKKIVIDGNQQTSDLAVTQTLAHEAGHALYGYVPDYSSRSAFVRGALADEGAATLNNIQVQREIISNGGPNIGIAGNPGNHAVYEAAYSQFLKDGNAAAARDAIGQQFGFGEKSSVKVNGLSANYNDYYGNAYDKSH